MIKDIFSQDIKTEKEAIVTPKAPIEEYSALISSQVSEEAVSKGKKFADEITERFVANFEQTEEDVKKGRAPIKDLMVHVSTFKVINDVIYMTYYANVKEAKEDPNNQMARLVYCPVDNPDDKTFIDLQSVGDMCYGKKVTLLYDTILMQKDSDTIYILWTAKIEDNYYRLYRSFTISTKTLGDVMVNRFKVGDIVNDFSTTGIQTALTEKGIGYKEMFSDIGIMQKLSTRTENGVTYYYTGAYSGDFTCIIKSTDLITWEYVSEPDFKNESIWENATYVIGDKCFYFVRQHDPESKYGFLTTYDLVNKKWETPVLIEDCQSRSDFIIYNDELYLFHAPIDREHIGIVKINTENISESTVVLQAKMNTSCFYPFIQYFKDNGLAMSYTDDRKHITLAEFDLGKYL